jgi:hypothetical protein
MTGTPTLYRPRPLGVASRRSYGTDTRSLVLFAFGLSTAVQTNIIGTVYLADVIALCGVIVTAFRPGPIRHFAAVRGLLIGLAIWLAGSVLTDLVRHTEPANFLRGWGRIVFFGAALIFVWIVSDLRLSRIAAFFLGLVGAMLAGTAFFPSAYQLGEPWKFGYAPALAILAALASAAPLFGRTPRQFRQILILGGMALTNLVFNYRSMFAILLGAALVTLIAAPLSRIGKINPRGKPVLQLGMVLILAILSIGAPAGYGVVASSGMLGDKAKQKYMEQTSGDMGLLLGGRSESLGSVAAIKDSPIIGHGSWASDRYYVALRILMLRARGVETKGTDISAEQIPSHSYLFGSWVESGIAGALFWGAVWLICARALLVTSTAGLRATGFVSFVCIQLLWNIVFSPFGAEVRFLVAGQLCIVFWALNAARTSPESGCSDRPKQRR